MRGLQRTVGNRRAGDVAGTASRFTTDAQLAMYAGTAPIPVSSGRTDRYRLNRRGNRQLNAAIHRIAISQLRHHAPAKAYVARRANEGKNEREAIRALKRHITRQIYNALSRPDLT